MSRSHSLCTLNKLLILFLASTLCGCYMPSIIQNTIVTYPPHPIVPEPQKIVLANIYNVKAQSYRSNKEEQFTGLIAEGIKSAGLQLEQKLATTTAIEQGLVTCIDRDSCTQALMETHQATHVILITHFDAHFDQTDVEVTETDNGKEREAFYDIVVDIGYFLRSQYDQRLDTIISVRRQHSSRSVLSGLLAAGPNIVSNQEDALAMVHLNSEAYMRCLVSGSEARSRALYVTKEFEAVGDAFELMDYSGALSASEKLANAKDPKVASMAYYNCAVLLERLGRVEKVRPYLEESLRLQPGFVDAKSMLYDYRYQPR